MVGRLYLLASLRSLARVGVSDPFSQLFTRSIVTFSTLATSSTESPVFVRAHFSIVGVAFDGIDLAISPYLLALDCIHL